MIYDIAIIGGGASGILAAIAAANNAKYKLNIIIIEKMSKIGKKLLATGNGRCNMMNTGPYIYYGDSEFAENILGNNASDKLIDFFNKIGLNTRVDDENRVYPSSVQAGTVMEILNINLKMNNIHVKTEEEITSITKKDLEFIISSKENTYISKKLIVATGGCSSPKHGTDGSSFTMLKKLGLVFTDLKPALVPISTNTKITKSLSGIRLKVRLYIDNPYILKEGELLFTDYGISGIVSMQISRFCDAGKELHLDLRPAAFMELYNKEQICGMIFKRVEKFKNENINDLLIGWYCSKISAAIIRHAGLADKKIAELNKNDIANIANSIIDFKLVVNDTRGYANAQVMAGGLKTDQFNPNSMESNTIKGLYCTGELLNVDGDCGGYNLMFAFASGIKAGEHAAKTL